MNECYVYVLIDPENNSIFYVGKGTGYRDSSHLKPSMWLNPNTTTNPFLYFKIKSLMEKNTPPIIKRLCTDLSEHDAYDLETRMISEMGRRFVDGGSLFNLSDYKGGSCLGKSKPWTEDRKEKHKRLCEKNRIYNPSYRELHDDYVLKGMKRVDIAKENNVSESLVKKRLQEYNIKKPKDKCYPNRNLFTCKCCGKSFSVPNSVKNRYFCSKECYRR